MELKELKKDEAYSIIKRPDDMPLFSLVVSLHDLDVIVGCIKANIENIKNDYRLFAGSHDKNQKGCFYNETLQYYESQINSQTKILERMEKPNKMIYRDEFANYITGIANYLFKESYELNLMIRILSKWNSTHPNDDTSKMLKLRFQAAYEGWWENVRGIMVPQEDKRD